MDIEELLMLSKRFLRCYCVIRLFVAKIEESNDLDLICVPLMTPICLVDVFFLYSSCRFNI